MTCPSDNAIAAMIDGAIEPAARVEIEAHVASCAPCATTLAELGRALAPDDTLRAWQLAAPRSHADIVARWVEAIGTVHREGAGHGGLTPDTLRIVGSPRADGAAVLAYLAPEQLRGEAATALGDQFALCCGLWEALVGALPFTGATRGARLVAIEMGPVWPRASAVDRTLRVLARGLVLDPARRWPDLDALARALTKPPARGWLARWFR